MPFGFQVIPQQVQLGLVAGGVELAAQHLEAQEHQPGVEHVGFAVVADRLEVAGLEGVEHLGAAHPHLSGEAQQGGDLVQRRVGAAVEHGQLFHQVQVALVEAAQVIVEAEAGVFVAGFPEAARHHAVLEGAVVEHRQVEAAAVPADDLRGEAVDAVVEALDQLFLGAVLVAQGPDFHALGGAQHHGDRHHPVQVQAQKLGAVFLAAQIEQRAGGVLVTEAVQVVNAAAAFQVGHRLDIKHQHVHWPASALPASLKTPVDR